MHLSLPKSGAVERIHVSQFLETEQRAFNLNAYKTQTSAKIREIDGCMLRSGGIVSNHGGHLPPPGAAPPQTSGGKKYLPQSCPLFY